MPFWPTDLRLGDDLADNSSSGRDRSRKQGVLACLVFRLREVCGPFFVEDSNVIPSKPLPNLHPGDFAALGVIGGNLKPSRARTSRCGMMISSRILVTGFPTLALVGFRLLSQLGDVDTGDPCSSRYSFSKSMAFSESYTFCSVKLASNRLTNRDSDKVMPERFSHLSIHRRNFRRRKFCHQCKFIDRCPSLLPLGPLFLFA